MKIYSLYKIINKINGDFYVGITKDPKYRFQCHIACAKQNKKQSFLYKSMRAYGPDNFMMEIIYESADSQHIALMEIEYIKESNPKLNQRSGGTGGGYRPFRSNKSGARLAHIWY